MATECCCCCHDIQKESVCPQLLRINCATPVPSHLGVATPGDSGTSQPSSTHRCLCSRAPKNRLAQKFDSEHAEKIQEARRDNVEGNTKIDCALLCRLPAIMGTQCEERQYQQNQYGTCYCRCRQCAGHFWGEEQDENRAQEPSQTLQVENREILPKATLDDA